MGGTIYTHCPECGETWDKLEGIAASDVCPYCTMENKIISILKSNNNEYGLRFDRVAWAIKEGVGSDLPLLLDELNKK